MSSVEAYSINTMRSRAAGFDLIRIAAAAAVFYQHGCTLLGYDDWTIIAGIRIGRLGTAVFLGLSGYLAAITSRTPERWLWQRACKLFPAYWIVLVVSFIAVAVTGYKSFDAWQVFCQFAGIGLFTHQGQLVNVTTWFVSALFALYVIAYLGLRSRGLAIAIALGLALAIGIDRTSSFETIAVHSVTFLAAYSVGRMAWVASIACVCWSLIFAGLAVSTPEFRYGAVALAIMALSSTWRGEWSVGQLFATIAYEWFLVHGICLHAVIRGFGKTPELVLPAAAGCSIVAAITLRRSVEWARRLYFAPIRLTSSIKWTYINFRAHESRQLQSNLGTLPDEMN